MSTERRQGIYDHRLVHLIQKTGDATIATRLGVPRSTAAGWLRRTSLGVSLLAGGWPPNPYMGSKHSDLGRAVSVTCGGGSGRYDAAPGPAGGSGIP